MLRRSRPVEGLEKVADFEVVTRDAVRLSAYTVPPSPGADPSATDRNDVQLVLCHGFTNHSRRPRFVRVVRRWAAAGGPVTAFDFRGHGRSGGASSVGGDDEVTDLDAVVERVRSDHPDATIAVVGFSMGASVAIRHAALGQHRPDLLVSVSAVSRWYTRDTTAMRRVHWLIESSTGPAVSRFGLRTRLGARWVKPPIPPVEAIASITAIPMLLVHGSDDQYFGIDHAKSLYAASGERADLWIIDGFGHAEGAMTPRLASRIHSWVADHALRRTAPLPPTHDADEHRPSSPVQG